MAGGVTLAAALEALAVAVWGTMWPSRLVHDQMCPGKRDGSRARERSSQVQVTDLRVVQYVGVRSLQPNAPALHHHPMCRQTQTRAHILLNQHDCSAISLHSPYCLNHQLERHWIKAH